MNGLEERLQTLVVLDPWRVFYAGGDVDPERFYGGHRGGDVLRPQAARQDCPPRRRNRRGAGPIDRPSSATSLIWIVRVEQQRVSRRPYVDVGAVIADCQRFDDGT